MGKEKSTILKGVAILLMLFYHLFYKIDNALLCDNLIMIFDKPFVTILAKACHPVCFFTILSGYGLYLAIQQPGYSLYRKVLLLYIRYWLTAIIFVPLGYFIVGEDIYPGSTLDIIENLLGISTSWNGEIWFLLPFCILMLLSRKLSICVNNYNTLVILSISFGLSLLASILTKWFGASFFFANRIAYVPVLSLSLLLGVVIGMVVAKYKLFSNNTFLKQMGGGYLLLMVIIIVALRCIVSIPFLNYIYAAIMLFILSNIRNVRFVDKVLYSLGKHSTTMWFIHTYIAYYYFHDFIFSFRRPVLIFIILVVISYVISVAIDRIFDIIKTKVKWTL